MDCRKRGGAVPRSELSGTPAAAQRVGSKGREAVASRGARPPVARRRLAQLWQLPLLLGSLGLFGYAAYLFIDPKPGLSIEQRIELGRTFLVHDRPDAAVDQLNKLLASEKLSRENEARVHLMLA